MSDSERGVVAATMRNDEPTRPPTPGSLDPVCSNVVAALTRVAQVLGALIEEVASVESRVAVIEAMFINALRAAVERQMLAPHQAQAKLAEWQAGLAVEDAVTPLPRMKRAALDKAIDELLALLDAMGAPVEIPPRGTV